MVAGKSGGNFALTDFLVALCPAAVSYACLSWEAFSPSQVLAVFAVTAISVVISAAIGTVIALWREKTFQAIALTVSVTAVHRRFDRNSGRDTSDASGHPDGLESLESHLGCSGNDGRQRGVGRFWRRGFSWSSALLLPPH